MTRTILAAMSILAASNLPAADRGAAVEPWGKTPAGEIVQLYTLTNAGGLRARIATYGGTVVSLEVPDKNGALGDVVLGFDSLDGYLGGHPYFGALVGRYGNRIAKAQFRLDGRTYRLAANNGPNHLHGGVEGFDKKVWSAKAFESDGGVGLTLHYISRDGEEGYPGALAVQVRYTLTDGGALRIEYEATTDRPTVVNLTNHSYFNLKDGGATAVLDHEMTINADRFTPVDSTLIPTGELRPVADTPFDFRQPMAIGARIGADDEQIRHGGGYDHNFVLNRSRDTGLELAARVYEPSTGRVMEAHTSEPGVQFYTGNFLDGSLRGKGGVGYGKRAGFCLETQNFPDSPNKIAFPPVELWPGAVYRSVTEYRFSVRQ